MPPPKYTLENGPLELGGIILGTASGSNFTPGDNITIKDPITQKTFETLNLSSNGWFEYIATDNATDRTLRIMFDIQGTDIFVEWFDDFGSVGGSAVAGNLFDGSLRDGDKLCFNEEFFYFAPASNCPKGEIVSFSVSGTTISLEESIWEEADSTSCQVESFCIIEAKDSQSFEAKFDINIGKFDGGEIFISVMPPMGDMNHTDMVDTNYPDNGQNHEGNSDYTPFNGIVKSGNYLCSNELGLSISASSCNYNTLSLGRYIETGSISLPVDSQNNEVWNVTGCSEYIAADIQGPMIDVYDSVGYGAKISNPCTFTYGNDSNVVISLFYTFNNDGDFLVEETKL